MPTSRRKGKSSGKTARRQKNSEQVNSASESIETEVADKVMHGPYDEGHQFAFAEEEAELIPAHMINTMQYKQVGVSYAAQRRGHAALIVRLLS